MLVLQRRAGESIVIGDDIEIAIISVGITSVKLAIQAPKELVILRNELVETTDVNKAAAEKEVNVEHLRNFIVANRKKGQETQYRKNLEKRKKMQKIELVKKRNQEKKESFRKNQDGETDNHAINPQNTADNMDTARKED